MQDTAVKGTKENILKQAEILFYEKGYDKTGIDEIARNSGIAKSVIYYHFKNRRDILSTMIDNFFTEFKVKKAEWGEEFFNNPKMDMNAYLKNLGLFMEKRKRLIKIAFMESFKEGSYLPIFDFWDKNIAESKRLFKEYFREGVVEGQVFHKLIFKAFFYYFFPLMGYYIFLDRYCRHYEISRKKADEYMNEFLERYSKDMLNSEILNLPE